MSKTYRIRTEVGVDRQVNIELEQDFDQLEILSLKVRSEDVYTRMCADYGVIVGRVLANGGYGVPNVRVSVFIPITDEDLNDEISYDLYPYRSLNDVNADGYLDIYVSRNGNSLDPKKRKNQLYINNKDLTFTESAVAFGLADMGFSSQAVFFDMDNDGDLDMYQVNQPADKKLFLIHKIPKKDYSLFRDRIYRNENGKFIDVSKEVGISRDFAYGLSVNASDFNNDGWIDLYVANDYAEPDFMYYNNGDGTFTNVINEKLKHITQLSMGSDTGDINNDGEIDLLTTDMTPEDHYRSKTNMASMSTERFESLVKAGAHRQYMSNALQVNTGSGSFSDIANMVGLSSTDWSWASLLVDLDNDGWKDIIISNGIKKDVDNNDYRSVLNKLNAKTTAEELYQLSKDAPSQPVSNYAFRNKGGLQFEKVSKKWGFDTPSFSSGMAYGDLDNDGDLDLVINNVNMLPFVYKNNSDSLTNNNYLKIKLEGEKVNNFGIGSTVKIFHKNKIFVQDQMPSRGFQSSMDYVMTIGLGEISLIDSLQVIWPDNKTQKWKNIEVNSTITLKQSEATKIQKPLSQKKEKTLITEVLKTNLQKHEENSYSDFDYEGLINKMLSQEGPALAVGDINNDGNDDFYVGGAKNQPGLLYLNLGNGKTALSIQKSFDKDAFYEDTTAAFFDANGDGNLDLMVGSGGNEIGQENNYKVRLYINNGKGRFDPTQKKLAPLRKNISVIAPCDFDNDGDVDIFVGARSLVAIYGVNPTHHFLENNGDGTFQDTTEKVAYEVKNAGMITDAIWKDVDNDGNKDLITVSEWDTPKIFINNGKRLKKQTSVLDDLHGMWNVVEAADLDNDGDLDFIFGNQGSNIMHKPSFENPLKMWVNDFDNNGTIEQIMTKHNQGKDYPIHMKKELTSQLVSLKKQNLKASEYAKKSIDELFPPSIFDKSIMKKSAISETIIAVNDGKGDFTTKKLPSRVQLSCVCGIVCTDVNNDGYLDIVMAGNNFEFKPQYSRLDASYGSVLLGDGNMDFTWQNYNRSGFGIKNEVKHLKTIKDNKGKKYLLAAINNESPKLFLINE